MDNNERIRGFVDPFAGTPKAATKTSYGINNIDEVKNLRNCEVYEQNGLMGMKGDCGDVVYPPEYTLIAKCIDYVFFLDPKGFYKKVDDGWEESGYMDEDDRPYVVGKGKVGFKVNDKVVIPPVYDYVRHAFGSETFYAEKDGKFYYLDINGNEVLTRIQWFDGEDHNASPLYLCTDQFDHFTAMEYVGKPVPYNPNVIQINGSWIELKRYDKENVASMLMDANDDLALSEKNLALLYSDFSYEYSLYFANAQGESPLKQCMEQFKQMDAFCNSWYYVVKLWQASGEHVSAKDLRDFRKALKKTDQLGELVIAVGHDEKINSGEVRMMLITHYHERCWPQPFEFEWSDKCRKCSLQELMLAVPELKEIINNTIMEKYQKEVFLDQIKNVIVDLKYNPPLSWSDVEPAIEYFYQQGSPCAHVVNSFLKKAEKQAKLEMIEGAEFYLQAVIWALNHGAVVNDISKNRSSLDVLHRLADMPILASFADTISKIERVMILRGAKTKLELDKEEESNTDYFKELDRMRL